MSQIEDYLQRSAEMSAALATSPGAARVQEAADLVTAAIRGGGRVMFCGNGGSAADAQHLAAELMGRLLLEREPYAAVALTTDTSVLTAIGNDYGYEHTFSRQVTGLGQPGDVLVGITTSGGSRNVIEAAQVARAKGIRVIALLGPKPSPLDELADVALHVQGDQAGHIQQGHITLGHALCNEVEADLAGTTSTGG